MFIICAIDMSILPSLKAPQMINVIKKLCNVDKLSIVRYFASKLIVRIVGNMKTVLTYKGKNYIKMTGTVKKTI